MKDLISSIIKVFMRYIDEHKLKGDVKISDSYLIHLDIPHTKEHRKFCNVANLTLLQDNGDGTFTEISADKAYANADDGEFARELFVRKMEEVLETLFSYMDETPDDECVEVSP